VDGCTKAFRQLSSLQQHLKGHNIPLPKSYSITRTLTTYSNGHLHATADDHHRKVRRNMCVFCFSLLTVVYLTISGEFTLAYENIHIFKKLLKQVDFSYAMFGKA